MPRASFAPSKTLKKLLDVWQRRPYSEAAMTTSAVLSSVLSCEEEVQWLAMA